MLAVLHRLRPLQSKVIVRVFQALNGLGRNAYVHILPQDSNLIIPDPSYSWKVYKKGVLAFILWHWHFGMTSKVTPDSLMLAWGHFLNLSWRNIFFFKHSTTADLWSCDRRTVCCCVMRVVWMCVEGVWKLFCFLFLFFFTHRFTNSFTRMSFYEDIIANLTWICLSSVLKRLFWNSLWELNWSRQPSRFFVFLHRLCV